MARSRRAAPARRPAPPSRAPPSRPASTKASPPPQQTPQQSHVPAPQQSSGGGMLSGIGSTIAQGFAFGTGSAVAHRAVGAVADGFSGSGSKEQSQQSSQAPEYAAGAMPQQEQGGACSSERQVYYDCLRDNRDDGQVCQFLLEQLKQCNQNQIYS